ncbi:hypothetical protein DI487_01885 [Flavobacterium sediminis]|uniref:histidine kinase n=1 Tax=Flavobacterium sediminis TaxID=2201181 RepID=A0A2U8QRF6_9FLAO|nr:PAS domain S-box protein [Flavobacterium sediminis]AWM12743.1 hypothetical protein DI487_01885 [Flavobacterium sediminis]
MGRLKITAFALILLTSLLLSHLYIGYQVSSKEGVSSLINIAGRQRMLSQKMLSLSYRLKQNNWENPLEIELTKKELTDIISQFQKADSIILKYTTTIHHNASLDSIKISNTSINHLTFAVNQVLQSQNKQELSSAVASLEKAQSQFLVAMESEVDLYENYGKETLKQISRIEIIIYAVLLLLTIILLTSLIFPFIQKIQTKNKSLEKSWERYTIFVEQMPGAIAMFDNNMNYLVASSQWYEDYNLVGQDIIGKSHYDVFPEIGQEWKQIHRECLNGKINHNDEALFERADGSVQWLAWDVRPWRDEKGNIGGIIMYTNDITDYKLLRLEQNRLHEIIDKISDVARIGAWELNIDKSNLYWSKLTKEIHEVPDDFEPTLDTAIQYYNKGESREKIEKAIEEAVKNGEPFDLELEIVTAKNNIIWVRAIGEPEFKDGKCVRLFGVFQDIHKYKTLELRNSSLLARLNAIMQSATEISIIGTNLNGIITYFNSGAEKLLGYKAKEIIGKKTPEIFHNKEELIRRGKELSKQYRKHISGIEAIFAPTREGRPNTREWIYVRKDGTNLKMQLSVTALKNAEGVTTGFLKIATDLTETIYLQEALISSNQKLEELTQKLTRKNSQLANFAHIISHNLRSPVANLTSLNYLYTNTSDPEEKDLLMSKFQTVITRLSETLDTLVETLKIKESSNDDLELIYFDEILERTKEMLTGQILESDAKIISDFNKAENIKYKRTYLESIFLNMITNAIKYRSAEQAPVIRITTSYAEKGKTIVTFSDNGLGIDLEKYGTKLFGLSKTFHQHKDAKGVGLFMTKNQIESLGGTITVESQVNSGTTFTLTL